MNVWDQLLVVVGSSSLDGGGLRDLVIKAMHTSIGYLHMHAFALLSTDPFQLTEGCISDRVEELRRRQLHDIQDLTTRKLYLCLSVGVSPVLVARALHLVRDAPCSTGLCEKGHAAGALLRRQHIQYGSDLILTQSTLMQTSALFRKTKVVDTKAERLRSAIQKAQSRTVQYTARNLFCSKLIEQCLVGQALDAQESWRLRQQCIARHNLLFDGLSAQEQQQYRQEAALECGRRERHRKADIRSLCEELQQHLDEQEALAVDECPGVANEINSVRFTAAEIEGIRQSFCAAGRADAQQ
jgi:hypothetical protein